MTRPPVALWLSVLVVLLGGPPMTRAPLRPPREAPVVQHIPAPGNPERHYVRSVSSWLATLALRPERDRRLAHDRLLPDGPAVPAPTNHRTAAPRDDRLDLGPRLACRYPTFTTGPPSHA